LDLHGNAPDTSTVALLLIDVIDAMDFEGADELLEHALPMARRIADIKKRARAARIPVVYVNDNFGRWQSDFRGVLEHCLDKTVPGRSIATLLEPDANDYFVLKPKHSGFFSTTLDILLTYLGARALILTGLTGNICVLFTAHDAFLRDYHLVVPSDCVASITKADNDYALRQIRDVLKADTTPSTDLDLDELKSRFGS
jgi:nicotinamidase-related amidase